MYFLSHVRRNKFCSGSLARNFLEHGNWMAGMVISSNQLKMQFSIIIRYVRPKSHFSSSRTQTPSIEYYLYTALRKAIRCQSVHAHPRPIVGVGNAIEHARIVYHLFNSAVPCPRTTLCRQSFENKDIQGQGTETTNLRCDIYITVAQAYANVAPIFGYDLLF